MVNKKNNKKNPKVNPYWVYGGVIFLFILFQTFSGGLASSEVKKISQKSFLNTFLWVTLKKLILLIKERLKYI